MKSQRKKNDDATLIIERRSKEQLQQFFDYRFPTSSSILFSLKNIEKMAFIDEKVVK